MHLAHIKIFKTFIFNIHFENILGVCSYSRWSQNLQHLLGHAHVRTNHKTGILPYKTSSAKFSISCSICFIHIKDSNFSYYASIPTTHLSINVFRKCSNSSVDYLNFTTFLTVKNKERQLLSVL